MVIFKSSRPHHIEIAKNQHIGSESIGTSGFERFKKVLWGWTNYHNLD